MRKTILLLVCLASAWLTPEAHAAPGDITIEFMASNANWADQSMTGHAFICVGLHLNSGIKEECFGFYPKDGIKGSVYGPGCVDSELNGKCGEHPITRFSNVVVSVKKKITEDQRRAVYAVGKEWNAKRFTLGWNDCVAFSNAVAKAAGLNTPTVTAATKPATYVQKLKELNP